MNQFLKSSGLFVLTACAEILGCYGFFIVSKGRTTSAWLVPSMVSLAILAWLLTLHPILGAGRTYAAYGGVYVATAVLWMWRVERVNPDRWDLLGAFMCLLGMAIILLGPRSHYNESIVRSVLQ